MLGLSLHRPARHTPNFWTDLLNPVPTKTTGLGFSRYTAGRHHGLPQKPDLIQSKAQVWIPHQDLKSRGLRVHQCLKSNEWSLKISGIEQAN